MERGTKKPESLETFRLLVKRNVNYDLLVPCEIGFAVIAAPEEREGGQRVGAVGRLVGLDMAVQMEDVAHLIMTNGRVAPTSIRYFAKAWAVATETVVANIA